MFNIVTKEITVTKRVAVTSAIAETIHLVVRARRKSSVPQQQIVAMFFAQAAAMKHAEMQNDKSSLYVYEVVPHVRIKEFDLDFGD